MVWELLQPWLNTTLILGLAGLFLRQHVQIRTLKLAEKAGDQTVQSESIHLILEIVARAREESERLESQLLSLEQRRTAVTDLREAMGHIHNLIAEGSWEEWAMAVRNAQAFLTRLGSDI